LLLTTTICLLSEAKRRKILSCWARNWITRRQQHIISNLKHESSMRMKPSSEVYFAWI